MKYLVVRTYRERQYVELGVQIVSISLPFYTPRIVADHTALVHDLICQCGGHPFGAQDLGPAVLPGLVGALSGHTGHAQNQGTLPIL